MNLPFLCSTSAQLPRGGRRWAGRRPSPGPLVAPRAHFGISVWEMRETSQIRFHNKTIIASSAEKLLLVVSKGSNTRAGFLNHMRRWPGAAAHADTGVRPPAASSRPHTAALLRAPAKLPSRTHAREPVQVPPLLSHLCPPGSLLYSVQLAHGPF